MPTSNRAFPEESVLAKFVTNKKELKANGSIRGRVLSPRPSEELSTFEVTDMKHVEICAHGTEHVNSESRKQIGYVQFKTDTVIRIGLNPIYDNDPDRHVSIEFPDDDVKRKLLGKRLEAECLPLNGSKKECFEPCC